MATSIRALRKTDREALAAALASDATFREDEIAVALELIDDALASDESDYWVRVAETDGAIAGYICFGPTPMTRSSFDLYWVVVHADFRGRGLAGELITAMEAELRAGARDGGVGVRVETSESEGYGAARRLYDKLGYPERARLEGFYQPGDDLIIYFKRL